jgi:hypothetical protein
MAWFDRLKEGAYTSPSGTRTVFQYEDVKVSLPKKTAAFDFVDAKGTLIQDNGVSGRRYPLRLFFWGADYDLEAENFLDTLSESGAGRLEHPIYGTVDVVPFGEITRRDDLKTAANQSVIEVVFWSTIGASFSSAQTDPASAVSTAVSGYNNAAAAEYAQTVDLSSEVKKATVRNEYSILLGAARSGLEDIAEAQDDVNAQFNAIFDSIDRSINALIDDPLSMAFQAILGVQVPSFSLVSNIANRLEAYSSLADSVTSSTTELANDFRVRDLFASTYVTGLVLSSTNAQFSIKSEALSVAGFLLDKFSQIADWRDDNFQIIGADESTESTVDTGQAYQQLQEAVSLAAGFLVEISFSLKQERRIVLDRNRTIVDLVAELYGSIDDQLDFFITSNDLSGDEILELPRGREVVYYV